MSSKPIKLLYWFRTDLRLHDSPALLKSLELQPIEFYPVWCWDPNYVYKTAVGPNRWQFLLDSMNDLSQSIHRLNDRSKLFVIRGDPLLVLPYVWKKWGITHIGFEGDDDNRYSQPRDRSILELAQKEGIQSIVTSGHTLYDQNMLIEMNNGQLPKSYQSFVKLTEKIGPPPPPMESPTQLPNPGSTSLDDPLPQELLAQWRESLKAQQASDQDLNKKHRTTEDIVYDEQLAGPGGKFQVPTMQEMGIGPATTPHRGGERVGLKNLEDYLKDKTRVLKFEKPKTSPAEFDPASTTVLSPHLKFGTISCRFFYHKILALQKSNPNISSSKPPESLIGQLLWREYFHLQQSQIDNFHQIKGNPVCRYFDWRLKDQIDEKTEKGAKEEKEEKDDDREAERLLIAWRDGLTGYPWIDAIMRQLSLEGWIHHLARHSVACFLTRGHLYISWERGAEVFDELLIDWDPSVNAANWMWLSASAYFQQYFRIYSPIQFGKKWDAEGKYIKRYCPELKDFPQKFIFQPWEAPLEIQRKANCIIGKDYPNPIVDEKEAKEIALKKMKEGYGRNLFGDHPDVQSGLVEPDTQDIEDKAQEAGRGSEKKRKAKDDEAQPNSKQTKSNSK